MTKIKLSGDEIGFIAAFQRLTQTTARDVTITNDSGVVFVINQGDMGRAIGKKGTNIRQATKILNKEVHVVEYSEDPVKFISNAMHPLRPKNIIIEEKNSKRVAKVSVEKRDRASAIGSKGRNIQKLKRIVTRNHDIDDVMIQ
jgi:N utilization substance protein A